MRILSILILVSLVGCTDETKSGNYTLGTGGGDNAAAGDQATGDAQTGDEMTPGDTTPGDSPQPGDLPLLGDPGLPGDFMLPGDILTPGDFMLPGDIRIPGDFKLPGDGFYSGDTYLGICGGIAGFLCSGNTHCIFPIGTCMVIDNLGSCEPITGMCPGIYSPVCGCNGVTYSNSCVAHRAGISIDHTGECT